MKKAQVKRAEAAREPELLNKLDEIVDRVVISRSENPADNEEVWAAGGALGGDKASALSGESRVGKADCMARAEG